MQRGQAFDAFKLLIAAVVAGAILVILLSMIGGFVSPGQAPLTVMGQEMNKVKKGGVCSTSTLIVQFTEGEEFSSEAVAREAGMNPGNVEFCAPGGNENIDDRQCSNYEFGDNFFEAEAHSLIVNTAVSGKIRACCPIESNLNCIVGFRVTR